jgi:hypothetical protein
MAGDSPVGNQLFENAVFVIRAECALFSPLGVSQNDAAPIVIDNPPFFDLL